MRNIQNDLEYQIYDQQYQRIQQDQINNEVLGKPTSILSSLLFNKREIYDSVLSMTTTTLDDKCIRQNAFNVINTNPVSLRSSLETGFNSYQVMSPRDFNLNHNLDNESASASNLESSQKKINSNYRSKSKQKQSTILDDSVQENRNGKFINFESIKEYFHKQEGIKARFDKDDMNILYQMSAIEFLILHRLFPKIYSISKRIPRKKSLSELNFNPSSMSQYEIFLVKSEVYIHTEQFEKALFFLTQGIQSWGEEHYLEFSYNIGLLHYVMGDYQRSTKIYTELLSYLLKQKDLSDEGEENSEYSAKKAVAYNLMLSLLREGECGQANQIGQRVGIQKVRMTLDTRNIEMQKLMIFAEQHVKNEKNMKNKINHIQQKEQQLNNQIQSQKIDQFNVVDINQKQNPIYSQREEQDQQKIYSEIFKNNDEQKINLSFDKFVKKKINRTQFRHKIKTEKFQFQTNLKEETVNALSLDLNKSEAIQQIQTKLLIFKNYPKEGKDVTQKVVNKARFDIQNIKDTSSPDYILSMTQIIQKLQSKDGLEYNKSLQYQLKNLDDLMSQHQKKFSNDSTSKLVAFPFQKSQLQLKNTMGGESEEIKFNLADQCLRNLEELELEIALGQGGGNFKKFDPVLQHYKFLCNSIYNLCQEEGLFDILQEAQQSRRRTKNQKIKRKALYPGAKPKEGVKYSVAKDILVSSLLKKGKGLVSLKDQNNSQLVEIQVLQSKIQQLKEVLKEEMDESVGKNKSMEYIGQAETEINKMLAIARKKQREREKYQNQDQDSQLKQESNIEQSQLNFEDLIKTKTLQFLLRQPIFQEEIARRFKVDRQTYLMSLTKSVVLSQSERESSSGTHSVIKNMQQTQKSEIIAFLEKSQKFLDYVFDNYGAFFISQRTYCMSNFLEYAPSEINEYFDNVSSLLSTIPMRFEILTDSVIDDAQFSLLESTEFVYNRLDLIYKLVSQGLRHQRYIDYIGLEKHDWIVEVIQKFNLLSIINYIFREALRMIQVKQQDVAPNLSEEDKVLSNEKPDHLNWRTKNLFNEETLRIIRDQFAKLKFKGQLNEELVDKFLGNKIQFFKQFQKETRIPIYKISQYKTIKDHNEIPFNEFDPTKIIVVVHGSLILQLKNQPDSKWETYQILNSGSVIPGQYLYLLKLKHHDVRLTIERGLKLHSQSDNFEYLEIDKFKLSELLFSGVKETLIKKIQLLQNVDLLGGSKIEQNDLISPYALFVFAALCKVQVFKFSEVITKQNDVPSGMNVILEGNAQAVFEDLLNRKEEVSSYFRKSMKTDLPPKLKFGSLNTQLHHHIKNVHSMTNKSINLSNNEDYNKVQISPQNYNSPQAQFKFTPITPSLDPTKLAYRDSSFTDKQKDHSITFQNLVLNENWKEHQNTNRIQYKHHIIFDKLREGAYFGSRIVMDEAAVKNFIKNNQDRIRRWIQSSQRHQEVQDDQNNQNQSSQKQLIGAEAIEQFNQDYQAVPQSIFQFPQESQKFLSPVQLNIQSHIYEETEQNLMKNYLLRSQLTVLAASSVVKVILITRNDKTYFNETTKKIFDERITEKEYLDIDRPMKKLKDLERIRLKEKDWDRYKLELEEQVIRDSYFARFDKLIFK